MGRSPHLLVVLPPGLSTFKLVTLSYSQLLMATTYVLSSHSQTFSNSTVYQTKDIFLTEPLIFTKAFKAERFLPLNGTHLPSHLNGRLMPHTYRLVLIPSQTIADLLSITVVQVDVLIGTKQRLNRKVRGCDGPYGVSMGNNPHAEVAAGPSGSSGETIGCRVGVISGQVLAIGGDINIDWLRFLLVFLTWYPTAEKHGRPK